MFILNWYEQLKSFKVKFLSFLNKNLCGSTGHFTVSVLLYTLVFFFCKKLKHACS